jgi:hypothetical protein
VIKRTFFFRQQFHAVTMNFVSYDVTGLNTQCVVYGRRFGLWIMYRAGYIMILFCTVAGVGGDDTSLSKPIMNTRSNAGSKHAWWGEHLDERCYTRRHAGYISWWSPQFRYNEFEHVWDFELRMMNRRDSVRTKLYHTVLYTFLIMRRSILRHTLYLYAD